MARKSTNGSTVHGRDSGGTNSAKRSGDMPKFIEGFLNSSDKEWLDANRNKAHELIFELLTLAQEGYSVSVKLDERSGKIKCSLTCSLEGSPNLGSCLVTRGRDSLAALYASAYKHFIKHQEVWGDGSSDAGSEWD